MRIQSILGLVTLVSALTVSLGSSINRPEKSFISRVDNQKESGSIVLDPKIIFSENASPREKRLFDANDDELVDNSAKKPLNVILLLVNQLSQSELNAWSELQKTENFPFKGYLQSCQDDGPFCDCNEPLKINIAHLLSWAAQTMDMSTSVLYQSSSVHPSIRQKSVDLDEASWHPTDVMRKLRESFSQTMLRKLQDHEGDEEAKKSSSFLNRLNFRELASRTLEDLNGLSSEKGYLMVATATSDELTDALELIKSYAPENTLVVVSSTCPDNNAKAPVEFYSQGPMSSRLTELKEISEIPNAIRDIITEHQCQLVPEKCNNHQASGPNFRERNSFAGYIRRVRDNSKKLMKRDDPPKDATEAAETSETTKVAEASETANSTESEGSGVTTGTNIHETHADSGESSPGATASDHHDHTASGGLHGVTLDKDAPAEGEKEEGASSTEKTNATDGAHGENGHQNGATGLLVYHSIFGSAMLLAIAQIFKF